MAEIDNHGKLGIILT